MKRSPLEGYKTYDTSSGFGSSHEWRKAFHVRMGIDEARTVMGGAKAAPHVILGVSIHASVAEIKKAFRKMALACHPDRCIINQMTKAVADEKFKVLTAAYTVMMEGR